MGSGAPPVKKGKKGSDPFFHCPFCEADDVQLVSQFGGQLMTSQWQCRACGSYFEAVREDFTRAPAPGRE
jgi:transcription elongation factor Elf1